MAYGSEPTTGNGLCRVELSGCVDAQEGVRAEVDSFGGFALFKASGTFHEQASLCP